MELDEIIEQLENLIAKSESKFEKALYNFFIDNVEEFAKKAEIQYLSSTDIVDMQIRLNKLFEDWYRDKTLTAKIEQLLPNVDNIKKEYVKVFNDVNETSVKATDIRKLNISQKELVLTIANSFKRYGVDGVVKKVMVSGVANKWGIEQVKRELIREVKATTVKARAVAKQQASDAFRQYVGLVDMEIASRFNIKGYIFTPLNVVKDSRDFCVHVVKSLKGYVEKGTVSGLAAKYPDGLYSDTTDANFQVVRGGYRCRHYAISTVLTKEQYLKRFKNR